MATEFYVTANRKPDQYSDNVSLNDAVTYSFDFSPWAEDNSNVSSVTWTVESGQAAVSGQALASNVASALLTFSSSGKNLISILATTATQKKKIWLETYVKDVNIYPDDYGLN